MKQIEEYIESNTKLMEEREKEYEATSSESERLRLYNTITAYKYYIMGLQDALRYIEEEKERVILWKKHFQNTR